MTLIIQYTRVAALPGVIRSYCYQNDAWIVGSGADYLLGIKVDLPRDWDILIPISNWNQACKSIPEGSKTNAFGGVKYTVEGIDIDVWGCDLGWFLGQLRNVPAHAVNPKTMTSISVYKDVKRR